MRGEGGVDTHTYWGSEGGGNGIGEVEVGDILVSVGGRQVVDMEGYPELIQALREVRLACERGELPTSERDLQELVIQKQLDGIYEALGFEPGPESSDLRRDTDAALTG